MNQQAPAGWYPDGQGNERYWDGQSWSEQLRPPAMVGTVGANPKKDGPIGWIQKASADRKAAKAEVAAMQAAAADAAGVLITSGVFGTSIIEIYEHGFVRVDTVSEDRAAPAGRVRGIDKNTPFEKLRSIKYTATESGKDSGEDNELVGKLGSAVTGLIKGGKAIAKASATGLAVSAATSYLASSASAKSYLTITTDKRIHTLSNQTTNSVGVKVSNKAHNDVGLALEEIGKSVLGLGVPSGLAVAVAQQPPVSPVAAIDPPAERTLSERLRELAALHQDGILSDDEFTASKAKLLSGL